MCTVISFFDIRNSKTMVKYTKLGILLFAAITMLFVIKRVSQLNGHKHPGRPKHSKYKPFNKRHVWPSKNRTIYDKEIEVKLPDPRINVNIDYDKPEVLMMADKHEDKTGHSDTLWFNWLENPNMPDNGRVYSSVQERLEKRKYWLQSSCHYLRKLGHRPPNFETFQYQYKKHYMVNKNHKMLYCYLPKVANTNFRRVILGLEGVVPKAKVPDISGYDVYFVHDDKYSYLRDFSMKQQHYLLHSYSKFMVVRDPLERLLSGYRNKYFHPNQQQTSQFLNKIKKFYQSYGDLTKRPDISIRKDYSNAPLAFEEFLIYFTDTYDAKAYLNEHFTASNQLCSPCHTKVDYVAKFDTLYDDVEYIFKKLKIDIKFPGKNDFYYNKESTEDLTRSYYERIPKWLLIKVWDILKYDYVLFGFDVPGWFKTLVA